MFGSLVRGEPCSVFFFWGSVAGRSSEVGSRSFILVGLARSTGVGYTFRTPLGLEMCFFSLSKRKGGGSPVLRWDVEDK